MGKRQAKSLIGVVGSTQQKQTPTPSSARMIQSKHVITAHFNCIASLFHTILQNGKESHQQPLRSVRTTTIVVCHCGTWPACTYSGLGDLCSAFQGSRLEVSRMKPGMCNPLTPCRFLGQHRKPAAELRIVEQCDAFVFTWQAIHALFLSVR